MRKVLISAAAAVSTLAFAAPAAAQYYPAPAPVPYGYNGYSGYNNYGGVRSLQVRVDQLQRQIERLAQRRAISRDEYNGLQRDARNVERRLADRSRNGLNRREYAEIQGRIARLEQHISHEVNDGRRYGYNGYSGYNGYNSTGWVDRDRDGRNDRYEDDGGWRHD